jgi:hypothetical protein
MTSRPPLPKEGPLVEEPASSDPEAPETIKRRNRDEVEDSPEGIDSNQSPPPANSEGEDRRKNKTSRGLDIFGYIKIQRCTPRPGNFFGTSAAFIFV